MKSQYNNALLVVNINTFYETNNRMPKRGDLHNPGYGVYVKHFGSWSNALKQSKYYTEEHHLKYSDTMLFNEMKRYYQETGNIPIMMDFKKNPSYPSPSVYCARFTSWNNALQECLLMELIDEEKKIDVINKSFLVTEIKRQYTETGMIPASNTFNYFQGYPDAKKIFKAFGSWEAAIIECGFCLTSYKIATKRKPNLKNKNIQLERHGKSLNDVVTYKKYREMVKFKIHQNDLPKIPGYSNGLTMDHKFSCNDGFRNKIHPFIIGHPANCEFMSQSENSSKNSKSSITYDELKKQVIRWELDNNGRVDFYKSLFEIVFNTEDTLRLSKISGKFYDTTNGIEFWDHPNKYKTAKILADAFSFTLGTDNSLQNLIAAVTVIRELYKQEVPVKEIMARYGIQHSNPTNYLKQLGVKTRSVKEANRIIARNKKGE